MVYQINTYGNGDVIWQIFEGIVLMMGAGYESLLRLSGLLLIVALLVYFIARGRLLVQVFLGMLVVLALSFSIKATVITHDLVNSSVPDHVVGGVPLAVALPAYVASEVGYRLMVLEQTALLMPGEYQLTASTFNRAFFDMQKTMSAQLPTGDLQKNMTAYLIYCVFREISLNQLTLDTIQQSPDALAAIASTNSALLTPWYQNGNLQGQMQCPLMYTTRIVVDMAYGNADYELAMQQLRKALGRQDVATDEEVAVNNFYLM
jgi:hypothetical protein